LTSAACGSSTGPAGPTYFVTRRCHQEVASYYFSTTYSCWEPAHIRAEVEKPALCIAEKAFQHPPEDG
jgi:hypothetical protein